MLFSCFAWIFSIFFTSSSLFAQVQEENASHLILTPMPSQEGLPEPYRSAKLMPFNPQGWYSNAKQIESLFKQNRINVVIEVGCWLGLSTRHMATLLPSEGKLYAVDHWLGSSEHQDSSELPTLYDQFLSNVVYASLTNVIVPIRMSSLEAAALLSIMAIMPDLVYIDASHDTESVLADLNAWFPFVKGHGIICGDDWHWEDVRAAVEIFALEHQLTIDASENFWCLVE
jgi:hypothetical protein